MTYKVRERRGNPVVSGLRRVLARPLARRVLAVGGFAVVGWLFGFAPALADDLPADTASGIVRAPAADLDGTRDDGSPGTELTGPGVSSTERLAQAVESTGRHGVRRTGDHLSPITSPLRDSAEGSGDAGTAARRVTGPRVHDVPLLGGVRDLGKPRDLGTPLGERTGLGLAPASPGTALTPLPGGALDVAPGAGSEAGRGGPGRAPCAAWCAGPVTDPHGVSMLETLTSAFERGEVRHASEQAPPADLPVTPSDHPGSQHQGASGMVPSPSSGAGQQLPGVGDVAWPWAAERHLPQRAPALGAHAPLVRTAADEPSFSPD